MKIPVETSLHLKDTQVQRYLTVCLTDSDFQEINAIAARHGRRRSAQARLLLRSALREALNIEKSPAA
jgi:hypothetical protein